MTTAVKKDRHTIEDWLAQPEEARYELIDGNFIEKAAPGPPHAFAQGGIGRTLGTAFHRRTGGPFPGGWWILPEVDIRLGDNGFRPDLAGWRRERVPVFPTARPVIVCPDWVCEVLSDSNRANDLFRKMRLYHQAGVTHYWLLDPENGTLAVFRHGPAAYQNVLNAERHELVRAEPFDAIEVRVGQLLGDDPDD